MFGSVRKSNKSIKKGMKKYKSTGLELGKESLAQQFK